LLEEFLPDPKGLLVGDPLGHRRPPIGTVMSLRTIPSLGKRRASD